MYKKICLIGLGTLGGFLAKNLAELDAIQSLVLIDYDEVEQSNVKNSIYKKSDVGKYKTDCMYDKIHKLNDELEIITMNQKYVEGETKVPKCDLVIDCRDFTYDRGSEIDVRLYISSRYLVIDCRKNVKNQIHYEGLYNINLIKSDIVKAVSEISLLITTGLIKEYIQGESVNTIDINYLEKLTAKVLETHNNKPEIVLDSYDNDDKLINLFESSDEIIGLNKKYDINICLGDKTDYLINKTVPKLSINNINELTQNLLSVVNLPGLSYKFNSYIVYHPIVEKNICYVILIPETGAA